jgi:hypothetical protein
MQSGSCSMLQIGEALQILSSVADALGSMEASNPDCNQDFDRPSLTMLMFSTAFMALSAHDKLLTSAGEANPFDSLSGFGATFSPTETAQIRNALLSGQLRTLSGVAESIRSNGERRHRGPEICVMQEMAKRLQVMVNAAEKRLKESSVV